MALWARHADPAPCPQDHPRRWLLGGGVPAIQSRGLQQHHPVHHGHHQGYGEPADRLRGLLQSGACPFVCLLCPHPFWEHSLPKQDQGSGGPAQSLLLSHTPGPRKAGKTQKMSGGSGEENRAFPSLGEVIFAIPVFFSCFYFFSVGICGGLSGIPGARGTDAWFCCRMMPASSLRSPALQRSRASCLKTSPTSSGGCGLTTGSRPASIAPVNTN